MSKAKYISKLVDASGSTTSANVSYTGTLTGSTGILNIGSGQLYKDASGNVGIGTSSPASYGQLAVISATQQQIGLSGWCASGGASALNGELRLGNNTSYQGRIYYDTSTGLGNLWLENTQSGGANSNINYKNNGGLHIWWNGASERMRIDASGNVGIGTSSPQAKLQTSTTSDGAQAIFVGAQSTTEQTLLFRNQYYTNNSTSGIAAIGWIDSGSAGGNLTFKTSTNGGGTTNIPTERMRIDSSGNVGIGTSSPRASKLDVLSATGTQNTTADSPGLVNITGPSGPTGAQPLFVLGVNDALAANIGPAITFQARYLTSSTAAANIAYIAALRENATSGNVQGAITFNPRNAAGNFPEAMRINSSGYITKPYQPMASVNYTGASTGAFNPILYNNVLLNDGNCYNSSTGRFTCPVAGRYRVQANDMSVFQAATGCYLIVNKNGSAVSGIGYSRADGVAHNHASITAIIQCAVGDYLTLQQATSSYGNGYNHATFEFIG